MTHKPYASPPSLGAHCLGCGTSVPRGVEYCAACSTKNFLTAPRASIETAPQAPPAYARDGSPRPETDE